MGSTNGNGAHSRRVARRAEIEERRDRVMTLVRGGYSIRDIARHMEMSHGTVHRDIDARIKALALEDKDAHRYRAIQLQQIDELQKRLWPLALGNPQTKAPPDLDCVDRILKLMERRAKLLGLDRPVKLDVKGRFDVKQERIVEVTVNLVDSPHKNGDDGLADVIEVSAQPVALPGPEDGDE